MKKKTVGQLSAELQAKSYDDTHTAHDQMEESLTDWDKNIYECLDQYKKQYDTDFYIVVITKKERLMMNVLRNYFMARISCPTPDYDQTVYRYDHDSDILEFLWVIPSKEACLLIKDSALYIDSEEKQLVQFVLDFADGTLFEKAKKLNGESADSIFKE